MDKKESQFNKLTQKLELEKEKIQIDKDRRRSDIIWMVKFIGIIACVGYLIIFFNISL